MRSISAQAYQLLHRMLELYVSANSPFELVDPTSGEDLRSRVQLLLNRWPSAAPKQEHFNVTLINNAGIRKTPTEPPNTDAAAAISALFRPKATRWRIVDVIVVEPVGSPHVLLRQNGDVRVSIPPGGVVVMGVTIVDTEVP